MVAISKQNSFMLRVVPYDKFMCLRCHGCVVGGFGIRLWVVAFRVMKLLG